MFKNTNDNAQWEADKFKDDVRGKKKKWENQIMKWRRVTARRHILDGGNWDILRETKPCLKSAEGKLGKSSD